MEGHCCFLPRRWIECSCVSTTCTEQEVRCEILNVVEQKYHLHNGRRMLAGKTERIYQKGLISTLLYRAYEISSWHTSLHEQVENLKKIFAKNGYPSKFVDRCVFNFFNKVFEKRSPLTTVPKKEFLVVLPFLGSTSWKTKNALIRSFRELLPFSKLKIVFKTTRRLSSCWLFQEQNPQFSYVECHLQIYVSWVQSLLYRLD